MLKIEGLKRFNALLTEELILLLKKEAEENHNGVVSELLREILTQRYKRKKLMN